MVRFTCNWTTSKVENWSKTCDGFLSSLEYNCSCHVNRSVCNFTLSGLTMFRVHTSRRLKQQRLWKSIFQIPLCTVRIREWPTDNQSGSSNEYSQSLTKWLVQLQTNTKPAKCLHAYVRSTCHDRSKLLNDWKISRIMICFCSAQICLPQKFALLYRFRTGSKNQPFFPVRDEHSIRLVVIIRLISAILVASSPLVYRAFFSRLLVKTIFFRFRI